MTSNGKEEHPFDENDTVEKREIGSVKLKDGDDTIEVPIGKEKGKHMLTKDQHWNLWNATLKDVPKDYDFVIKSESDSFPKGS